MGARVLAACLQETPVPRPFALSSGALGEPRHALLVPELRRLLRQRGRSSKEFREMNEEIRLWTRWKRKSHLRDASALPPAASGRGQRSPRGHNSKIALLDDNVPIFQTDSHFHYYGLCGLSRENFLLGGKIDSEVTINPH